MIRICYVGGCGRLGYPMAVWTAWKGLPTIVADANAVAVQQIQQGAFYSPEPDVDRLAQEIRDDPHSRSLEATTNTGSAVRRSDIIFVLVQTPSLPDDSFSIKHVLAACRDIGQVLAGERDYKVVAVSSTVMPGHVNGPIRDCLEAASGKVAHRDFGLVYCPEFIRQGNIIHDFSHPDLILIGHENGAEVVAMWDYYRAIIDWTTLGYDPVHEVTIESAEIAKIGLNTAIVAKIARANELALLCHYTPGADAAQVTRAIGTDPRIGRACSDPGTPPGGPCFPRDNKALVAAMRERGLTAHVASAVVEFEQYQIEHLAVLAAGFADAGECVGLLGVAYKPGVNLAVGSQSMLLARAIFTRRPDLRILAYDPGVVPTEEYVEYAATLEELVAAADVLVLMTCWPDFKQVEKMDLTGKRILDVWGFLDRAKLHGCEYVRFGEGR